MRARRLSAAALCGILFTSGGLIACGGGGGGSTTSPSATVTSLGISPGTDTLKLRASESFTANATMSNGTTNVVTATWRSDNTSVATIDSTGRATGVASGRATITAEYQGLSANRTLRVVPDYQGTWRGFLSMRSCSATGDWQLADVCGDLTAGDQDTLSLTLSQQSANVSGTIDIGGFAGPITGTIADNGSLSLTGLYNTSYDGFPVQIGVSDWQTMSSDNSRMTGRFVFTVRSQPALSGDVRVETDLVDVNKTAATLMPMRSTHGALGAAVRRARGRVPH